MSIKVTTGTLDASTASTGTMVPLSGQAQWVYVSVWARTCAYFSHGTASTGTGTDIGLQLTSGETYGFQFQPGQAKYFVHVATGALPYCLMEIW